MINQMIKSLTLPIYSPLKFNNSQSKNKFLSQFR